MTVLNSKKILQDNNVSDPNSITNLILTHKALSDVSCLGEFKNLERLDLGFNNLSSVEVLKLCVNLKWLSVAQNKLQSLKGIEGLPKLTVLNAGKNKLKSMDDVMSLVSLRALILNDNEITSVCKLDKMKELNTLVLSRNPISEIGGSLVKTRSITKLSLSNCRLQTIGLSLTSCTELKELRLAHNEIKSLPDELKYNAKLLNLDVGNNFITNWSDLKALFSLVHLRNLNLQGNPIAEKETLAKKIKKLLPNLQIFNARPTEKAMTKEGDRLDPAMGKKNSKKYLLASEEGDDDHLDYTGDGTTEKGSSNKKQKNKLLKEKSSNANENDTLEKKRKKNTKLELNEDDIAEKSNRSPLNRSVEKDLKRTKQKKEKPLMDRATDHEGHNTVTTKGDKKSKKKLKQSKVSIIDDGEASFIELFGAEAAENASISRGQKMDKKSVADVDSAGDLAAIQTKNKKNNSRGACAGIFDLSPVPEVGLGGLSTWDD
ncbi:hypothetical protein ACH5RR_009683 [Cinchona calisaya]|uniref:Uncharacterized protein n=1 Tax=Cinchona calisaya TaxID=153742 RepID=A0ABD3AEZ0_9GENT